MNPLPPLSGYPDSKYCSMHTWRMGGSIEKGIYTEEETKVVASAWGTELLPFLAALAILLQDDLKIKI